MNYVVFLRDAEWSPFKWEIVECDNPPFIEINGEVIFSNEDGPVAVYLPGSVDRYRRVGSRDEAEFQVKCLQRQCAPYTVKMEMDPERIPEPGDIVHYVLDRGRNLGEVRGAMVLKHWGQGTCNLLVFVDGTNDDFLPAERVSGKECVHAYETSIVHDEGEGLRAPRAGTWHWK